MMTHVWNRNATLGLWLAAALATTASGQQVFKSALVPTARTIQSIWKFTTDDPGADWQTVDFADGAWSSGPGGFGSRITPSAIVGTEWTSSDIWLRKMVTLPDPATLDGLGLIVHHDEAMEIYVNGVLVLQDTGYSQDYYSAALDAQGRAAFKTGDNLIAVHCHQTTGGQFIDVGVEYVYSGTPTAIVNDARFASENWSWTTEDPGTSNWITPAFEDAGWNVGSAGFGTSGTPGSFVNTEWNTGDIWLRKKFNLADVSFNHVYLNIHHDENVMVAINGTTVLQMVGYTSDYQQVDITDPALAVMTPGENVIAVYCHQTVGGQYIDLGLTAVKSEAPVPLRPGKSALPAIQAQFRFANLSAFHPAHGILFPGLSAAWARAGAADAVPPMMFDVQGKGFPVSRARR